jgi:hypothetical protein
MARTITEVDHLIGKCVGVELLGQGGDESQAGTGHCPVVVEDRCEAAAGRRLPAGPLEAASSVPPRRGTPRLVE